MHQLHWIFTATHESVKRVQVTQLSADGKLPFITQVRALEDIKRGSLVLAPVLCQKHGECWQHGDADVHRKLESLKKDGEYGDVPARGSARCAVYG